MVGVGVSIDLSQKSLNQVDYFLRLGLISETEALVYVQQWNATEGRLSSAFVTNGRVKNRLFGRTGS